MLYKLNVMSANNLKQTDLARLERLQYRAAKLVTGALHLTSREQLNNELEWQNIRSRINSLVSVFSTRYICS